jgi:hypothetical protein
MPPFESAATPQRVGRLKKALRKDMGALKNGMPVSDTMVKTDDAKAKGKRKAEDSEADGTPKKRCRGRPKEVTEPEPEAEPTVKQEITPDSEHFGRAGKAVEEF